MAHCYGAVFLQQQHGHRFSDDVAAPDYDGFLSVKVQSGAFDHMKGSFGCAGDHTGNSCHQAAGIDKVESIHIFLWQDFHQRFLFIQMRGR